MRDITILLTGAGAPGAPGIINCLKNNGERNIRIVGVDANKKVSTSHMIDTFYHVPVAESEIFIAEILKICKKEHIEVVVPIVTRELIKFAENKCLFEKQGIKVSVLDSEILAVVNNKARLLEKMREMGMETPSFYVVSTLKDMELACKELGYPQKPICVKSTIGNGSRGVRLIDANKSKYDLFFNEKPNSMYMSYEELFRTLEEKEKIPEMMVMELLPGEEYGVDFLCDNGKILYSAGRYNYTVNNSIPQGCILEYREEPFNIATEISKRFGISGNINFDFKYDRNGNARLIEINPRLSATIVAYAAAGLNLPYLGVKILLEEKLPDSKVQYGVVMERHYQEVFFDRDGKRIEWKENG